MRKRISRKYPMSDAMLVLFVRLMITRLLRDLAVLGAKFGLTTAKLTELGTQCTAFDERHCSCLRGERRGRGRFKAVRRVEDGQVEHPTRRDSS